MGVDQKSLNEIIARLEKEVAARPKDTRIRLQLALSYMRTARPEDAIRELSTVIEEDRRSAEAHYYLGILHADQGDLDKAQESFEKAIAIDKRHGPSHYFLGKLMVLRGNVDGAIKETEKALEAAPGNVMAHAQLGELYIAKGRPSDALTHWQKVLELDPSNLQALHNLGALSTDAQKHKEALEYLLRAERLGSENPGLFYNMGICYYATKETDRAVSALEKSVELEPDNVVTLTTLGEVYATGGDLDRAIETWEKALEVKPDSVFPTYNLGLAFYQKKETEKAVELWEKSIRLDATYVPAYRNLAAAAVMAGDTGAAIAWWEALEKVMPGSPEPALATGDLSFRNGDFAKAGDYARGLLDRLDGFPDPEAHRELRASAELLYGSALIASGKPKEGVSHWVKSMEADPNFALANSAFISRAIWPGLVEDAKAHARSEDQRKAASLVGSLVAQDVVPPAGDTKPEVDVKQRKKGGLSWFFRGRK